MAEFTVPKFIEREPVLIWKITFRQFMILALGVLVLTVLKFALPPFLFYLTTTFFVIFAFLAIFVKIHGRPFTTVLKNFVLYTFSPKTFLWKRKSSMPRLITKEKKQKEKTKEDILESPLQVIGKSKLKEIARRVETGI